MARTKTQSTKRTRKQNKNAEYLAKKQRAAAREREISRAGREIWPIPVVVHPDDKARAERDFRFFCETYFPETFNLPWSQDHLKVIDKIQQAVLHGGLFAVATPRGFGKSSLCEAACIWAVLYGHREFVVLIGSDESHAMDMLDSIKMELEGNDRLHDDFPEVTHPIRRLEGIANRCAGQLCNGKRTHIVWTAKEIVLPTVDGSKASGAIIKVAGLTGRIRGMKFKRPDGMMVRPSLVVIDDPQTDESARSLSQSAAREAILAGAILGLAGPGKKISGIMPCTVIRPGDLADNILDRNKHPEWNGERLKLVYSFPKNEKLWQKYAEIRAESFRRGGRGEEATEFYRQNRQAMDEGAVVAWPERYNPDEISAIQHAMNLKLQDERAFWAEYQNEPLPEEPIEEEELTADQVAAKLNRYRQREVPIRCNCLTAFIDVQQTLLYYVVTAWEDDFTGYVIDYSTFPKQHKAYFTLREARPTLAQVVKAAGIEGQIYGGLEKLTGDLLGREFTREDGAQLRIDRCLIDANWGQVTETVYQFCRQSPFATILMPSHGRFVGASSRPLTELPKRPGDRVGLNWRMPTVKGLRAVRYVLFDTNFWKSFVHSRLALPLGDRGTISIFGTKPEQHRLFAEHLTSEHRIRTQAKERIVDEWKLKRGTRENHWFDCLVGCAVAASIQGIAPEGAASQVKPKRISFAQLQRLKRARNG